ncbi:MAG TPA: hypothetical protein VHT26_22330, partial [Trebonia sp.]|nr:hypothetical protein [Trebonia sp.]
PLNQVRELGNASGPPQGRSPAEINDLWSAAPRALPGRLPPVFGDRLHSGLGVAVTVRFERWLRSARIPADMDGYFGRH